MSSTCWVDAGDVGDVVVVDVVVFDDGFFKSFLIFTFFVSFTSLFFVVVVVAVVVVDVVVAPLSTSLSSFILGIWSFSKSSSCFIITSCWCFWNCRYRSSFSKSSCDKLWSALRLESLSVPASTIKLSSNCDEGWNPALRRLDVGSIRCCCCCRICCCCSCWCCSCCLWSWKFNKFP